MHRVGHSWIINGAFYLFILLVGDCLNQTILYVKDYASLWKLNRMIDQTEYDYLQVRRKSLEYFVQGKNREQMTHSE